jgi:hypothetical protein
MASCAEANAKGKPKKASGTGMNGINAYRLHPRLNLGFDVIRVHPIHRRLHKDLSEIFVFQGIRNVSY